MNEVSSKKALFSQRILAFIVDMLILGFIVSLLSVFIPVNDTTNKLYDEQNRIMEGYVEQEISMEDYVNQMIDISYDISRQTVIESIVAVVVSLVYFVIYPFYNSGATLGKKLFKIKVKKVNNDSLSMNDLLIRSMINNGIVFDIIMICLVMFFKKDMFLASSSIVAMIQYIVMFISIILIACTNKKQGFHDKIVKTEVVINEEMKEALVCQEEN